MAKEMLEKLVEFLESEEGQKRWEKFAEEMQREEEHETRWKNRMWDRIQNDIDASIEHLLHWYGSDKYRDREYKMRYEPREKLLWVLLKVAEHHGSECSEEEIDAYANPFTGEMYKLGSYIIQVMHGQGSVIRIDKLKIQ